MVETPKIEFITSCFYWRTGTGYRARTREMLRFFSSQTHLNVIFLGKLLEQDREEIERLDFYAKVIGLDVPFGASTDEKSAAYSRLPTRDFTADLYIVDKIENSFMLDILPPSSQIWIDTHDLISERTRKLQGHEMSEPFPMTETEEIEVLGKYDLVICIQQREWEKVVGCLGSEKVVCVPHPVKVLPKVLRNPPSRIGFVASHWHANAYGLRDFLRNVWPRVCKTGATLHVYGRVVDVLVEVDLPAVYFHGFLENLDDCYKNIDIAINPVQYGAGLKIKSVEAMANGLPLVASPEGASGLEELDGDALLIAEDWDSFATILEELVNDYDRCIRLGKQGADYSRRHLSREACFAPLREKLGAFL